MTTMTPRRKAIRKRLRIRPELLPDSAVYGTFAGREYVMIPVEDFGWWFEDLEDNAVAEYARDNSGPNVPLDDVETEIRHSRKNRGR